jgi:hypothetical protein
MFFKMLFHSVKSKDVGVFDPVKEFRRDLGLDGSKKRCYLARVISAAHSWVIMEDANVIVPLTFAVAGISFIIDATIITTTTIAIPIALAVALFVTLGVSFLDGGLQMVNRVFSYTLLGELAFIAGGEANYHPVVGIMPLLSVLALSLGQGARLVNRPKVGANKTPDELVSEAFDQFLANHRPDLSDEKSLLNRNLSALDEKIKKGRDVLAKLRGELKAELVKRSDGERADALRAEIQSFMSWLDELTEKKDGFESRKADLMAGLQFLESVKSEALSYVHLRTLQQEVKDVRGESEVLSIQAERELEAIRERIALGLSCINTAVDRLAIASVSQGDVSSLSSRVESVIEQSNAREREMGRLKVV